MSPRPARNGRLRLVDSPSIALAEPEGQLSIFEVDPGAVALDAEAEAEFSAPAFDWTGIELDAQFQEEADADAAPLAAPDAEAATLILAPLSRRALAALVDGALIFGTFLVAGLVAAANIDQPYVPRLLEFGALAGLLLDRALYQALFFTFAEATPGMKYAGISLCTFDGQVPNRVQMQGRVGALLLSVLPLGVGLAWALFDEDHLTWHDRLSGTYQRKD